MPAPNPPDIAESKSDGSVGFAENYKAEPGCPDEMINPDGSLRPHWRRFVSMLDELGPTERRRRWDQARRLIHENGVTHNVYGDPNGLDRPWNLDLIPLLIPAAEWGMVADGLTQRARLLDRLLADLYGPEQIIKEGLLPAELIWGNPGFLRPCHGARLPQDRWLHLYAADLVRTGDGQYQVLSDRTQAPSGAGYTLENRIVLSRALPAVFRQSNVHRLASFFALLRDNLAALAPADRENPRIVLLTPGPYNETYFEHSYLARYLGYSLVEGNDLTVRDANVYLKTLGGLKRVDVILRRVDDHFCDPLELYSGSYLGVPGLLQSVRQGNVLVANALGSGVLQAPGFLPFLPKLCHRLLEEELKLPSIPSWWCGNESDLKYVLEHLPEMVIKSALPTRGEDPVFGDGLTAAQISELAEKIKSNPAQYVAQEQVMACTTPALIDEHAQPRRFVVRSFLAAHGDTYTVMPGALTRITQSSDSLVVSLQRGGGSKDTWILSNGPVAPVTLLRPASQPLPLSRGGGDLPSRVADNLYWLGRFVERAECQARLARGMFTRIVDPSGIESAEAIRALTAAWSEGTLPFATADSCHDLVGAVLGSVQGGGIRGAVAYLNGLARVLRNRVSADAWRILQEIYEAVSSFMVDPNEPSSGVLELLDSLVVSFAAFSGLAADSMTRGHAWRFLDMGRRIERVVFVARLLRDTVVQSGADPVLLEAVLEITDSRLTYRRRYLTYSEVHTIADLLLADETNPRAAAFQLGAIDQHLAALPRDVADPGRNQDQRVLLKLRTEIQVADLVELCTVPEGNNRHRLGALLSDILDQVAQLSDAIARLYFSHAVISRDLGDIRQEFT
jgi:uncharacterized circularly permuted ATP-grasp superfamily protein/uncharacterized alpha-E superfamily protein